MSSERPPSRRHRKHRSGHEEEHDNSERWLLTYADMLTLLMVLFIVMFAISQVDQKKFAALKNGVAMAFGSPSAAFEQSSGPLDEAEASALLDLSTGTGGDPTSEAKIKAAEAAVSAADRSRAQTKQEAAEREVRDMDKVKKAIAAALASKHLAASVRFNIDERGLVVTVITNSVVFAGDRADLLPAGRRIVAAIGPALRPLPNNIEIDGHTNQLPVPTVNYPSGWELSTARACAVLRFLADESGVPSKRLSASGFGQERPLYPASDPRSVTLNRRVEIIVLSELPIDVRALLPAAARAATAK